MQQIASRLLVICCLFWTQTGIAKSLFDFEVTSIDGKAVKFSEYKGKKKAFLIVNTASECGYTSQYKGLQKLYADNSKKGLVVLGFPSNNFGGQEPGTNQKIKKFCEFNYGVKFPLFQKCDVKGPKAQDLFKWLSAEAGGPIKWNFEKFLVGADGKLIKRFRSGVTPESEELNTALNKALK